MKAGGGQFIHSFPSSDLLESTDCLSDTPAIYSIPKSDEAGEPIYQNINFGPTILSQQNHQPRKQSINIPVGEKIHQMYGDSVLFKAKREPLPVVDLPNYQQTQYRQQIHVGNNESPVVSNPLSNSTVFVSTNPLGNSIESTKSTPSMDSHFGKQDAVRSAIIAPVDNNINYKVQQTPVNTTVTISLDQTADPSQKNNRHVLPVDNPHQNLQTYQDNDEINRKLSIPEKPIRTTKSRPNPVANNNESLNFNPDFNNGNDNFSYKDDVNYVIRDDRTNDRKKCEDPPNDRLNNSNRKDSSESQTRNDSIPTDSNVSRILNDSIPNDSNDGQTLNDSIPNESSARESHYSNVKQTRIDSMPNESSVRQAVNDSILNAIQTSRDSQPNYANLSETLSDSVPNESQTPNQVTPNDTTETQAPNDSSSSKNSEEFQRATQAPNDSSRNRDEFLGETRDSVGSPVRKSMRTAMDNGLDRQGSGTNVSLDSTQASTDSMIMSRIYATRDPRYYYGYG